MRNLSMLGVRHDDPISWKTVPQALTKLQPQIVALESSDDPIFLEKLRQRTAINLAKKKRTFDEAGVTYPQDYFDLEHHVIGKYYGGEILGALRYCNDTGARLVYVADPNYLTKTIDLFNRHEAINEKSNVGADYFSLFLKDVSQVYSFFQEHFNNPCNFMVEKGIDCLWTQIDTQFDEILCDNVRPLLETGANVTYVGGIAHLIHRPDTLYTKLRENVNSRNALMYLMDDFNSLDGFHTP